MKKFRSPQRPKKNTLIAGWPAVLQALKSGEALERIFVDKDRGVQNAYINDIRKLSNRNNVPLNYVPDAKLNRYNITGHDGIIALRSKIIYAQVQDIIDQAVTAGKTPLLVLLDGITDVRNIGGIARTAYAMGAQALIIPDKGVGAINEEAMLTSAGALEQLPVCRVNSLMKTVDDLHLNGIKVIGTQMNAPLAVHEADCTLPLAIILGSEEKGIQPVLLKYCDELVKIPMPGNFESLNVSVSNGIILYEVARQRNF